MAKRNVFNSRKTRKYTSKPITTSSFSQALFSDKAWERHMIKAEIKLRLESYYPSLNGFKKASNHWDHMNAHWDHMNAWRTLPDFED